MGEQQRGPDGKFLPASDKPQGWKPFVSYDDAVAEGQTPPLHEDASEADILSSLGLAAQDWEVTRIKVSKWQSSGDWLTAYRVSARRRVAGSALLNTEELLAEARGWAVTPRLAQRGSESLVVCLADWQIGKGERGGSAAAIDRILTAGQGVVERVEELRAIGRQIGSITVLCLGDIVESCSGFYPAQTATVDLDTRGQVRVSWQLLTALLRMWAPLVERVDVVPVGGNHGEVRSGASSAQVMGSADNLDLLVCEAARDVLAERADLSHVKFHLPDNPLIAVYDVSGVAIGVTHGHLMGGGSNPAAKAEKWWKGQAFGRGDLADARILVTGHYHHLALAEWSEDGRTWIQTPAMDGGSQWFRDISGQSARTGMLTFLAGRRLGAMGYSDLQVI